MGALIDLTGKQFGLLRVVKRLTDKITPAGTRQPMWGCICACGRRSAEEGRALRGRRALSCRCCVRDPSRTLRYGRVYLMVFPRAGIIKIGFHTSDVRIRELMAAGGIRVAEFRDVDKSWETAGRAALAEIFPPAFTSRDDARDVLPRGAGWSDCFTLDPDDIALAEYVVTNAGIRKGNDFGTNPPATPAWLRAFNSIQRARRGARIRRANAARFAGADGCGEPDAVGSGMDCPGAVPGGAVAVVDRPRHPRRHRAGRRRSRTLVGAERPRMARPTPATFTRPGPCTRSTGFAAFGGSIFIGLGERKRKRERTRARAGARPRTGTSRAGRTGTGRQMGAVEPGAGTNRRPSPPGASGTVGCSAVGVHGSPERVVDGVRAVWDRGRAAPGFPGQPEVPRRADVVRGVAVGGIYR